METNEEYLQRVHKDDPGFIESLLTGNSSNDTAAVVQDRSVSIRQPLGIMGVAVGVFLGNLIFSLVAWGIYILATH